MLRILVTDAVALGDLQFDGVDVVDRPGMPREEILAVVGGFDGLITRSRTQVDEALLAAAAPRLRVVGRGGVGVDNIDLDAASRHGVLVVNAPEANNVSAAELAIGLLLAAARGIGRSDALVRRGTWDRAYLGHELDGAALGIVGLGRIGSLVAKRAQGLGMRTLAYDPYLNRRRADELGVELVDDLHAMLAHVRFLTVHTPLTDETRGLIDAAALGALPRGAVVVNAARGGIVDEAALVAALAAGHLFAAGLDVFVGEPPARDHPLLQRDDVVVTAHLGANTVEAQARVGSEILERTVRTLQGDVSRGVVNAPALAPEVGAKLGTHLELGEALGALVAQLTHGRVRELAIEFAGTFPIDPDPIAVAVAKGFLEPVLSDPPTYVNALALAKDRDVRVSRTVAARSRGYTTHVLVTAIGDFGSVSVGGTVLGDHPRVVELEGFPIEIRPEGTMLVCTNFDRPGAVGRVGTVLGDSGVNISGMQLSRVDEDGLAMFALTLDQVPGEDVLEVLRGMSDVIHSLRVVRFA
ncbi:MAG: phosphoglycerate dehydrogenase [Trueperaceae bacterium]